MIRHGRYIFIEGNRDGLEETFHLRVVRCPYRLFCTRNARLQRADGFLHSPPDPIHTEQEIPRGGRSPQVLYAVNTPSNFSVSAVAQPYYGA